MEPMTSETMAMAFEAAVRQLIALGVTVSVAAMALMLVACLSAGILRRLR